MLPSGVRHAALALAASANAFAEAPAQAALCQSCHGADGRSPIPGYPHLAGQNRDYLVSVLNAYRAGERSGAQAAVMTPMAASLSDDDIAALADYYSAMDP